MLNIGSQVPDTGVLDLWHSHFIRESVSNNSNRGNYSRSKILPFKESQELPVYTTEPRSIIRYLSGVDSPKFLQSLIINFNIHKHLLHRCNLGDGIISLLHSCKHNS